MTKTISQTPHELDIFIQWKDNEQLWPESYCDPCPACSKSTLQYTTGFLYTNNGTTISKQHYLNTNRGTAPPAVWLFWLQSSIKNKKPWHNQLNVFPPTMSVTYNLKT